MNLTNNNPSLRNSFTGRNKQTGMGKWSWLFLIIFLVVGATQALRLGPHYVDFNLIQSIMDRLPAEEIHKGLTRSEIREIFKRQFRVENFPHDIEDIMTIERAKEHTTLIVQYEVREPLFYNMDIVLNFKDERIYE